MTDWYTILDYIERAREASEKFHEAGEALNAHPKEKEIQAFADKMSALQTELTNIYQIIAPGSPVALDELAEAFSQAMRGKHAEYRSTPEIKRDR